MADSPAPAPHSGIRENSSSPVTQQQGTLSPASVLENPTVNATVAYIPSAASVERDTLPPPPKNTLPSVPGYEVLDVLGRGGMGVVYKARQIKADRLVALKMILSGNYAGEEELVRFRSEAEAIARLQHPHIVQVFDVGEHEGQPYFSLEYCGGGSLSKHLRGAPLPAHDAARSLEVLAEAIHAAHQKGVIHRDLKPANILLQRDESGDDLTAAMLKITDFGLAKKIEDAGRTVSGVVMGTPSYMAPEQASGESNRVGPAADIYALGAILYELLTGRPPFRAATTFDTLLQVQHSEPVPPRRLQPKTPRDLETICLKCLHKDASRRYATAADLTADLGRFLKGEPIRARPVGFIERAAKWVRRRPASASLLAVAAATPLIALALAGWYLQRERQFNRQLLTKTEIAESNEAAANEQRDEAKKQTKRAQKATRDARLRLMQMHVARGVRLMEDSDAFAALPWLVAALKEDPRHEATAKQMHRYRIGALLRQSPKLVRMFFHPQGVRHIEFSPDGHKLFAVCGDQTVRIEDVATGKEFCPPLRHAGQRMIAASFSPDGLRALTISGDRKVHLWNATEGKIIRTLSIPKGANKVCFSPDGQRFVVADAERSARVWDARTGKAVSPPLQHADTILHVSFRVDGRWIVTASKDATARVWDAATGKAISPPLRHDEAVNFAVFSPNGKQVAAVSSDSKLRVWEVSERSTRLAWQAAGASGAASGFEVSFSPDGDYLVSSGYFSPAAVLWDVRTGRPIGQPLRHEARVYRAAFNSDGQWLVTTSEDTTARIWNTATGTLAFPPLRHAGVVQEAVFSPDDRLLATCCGNGAVRVWSLSGSEPSRNWSFADKIQDLSPDTRYAASLSPSDRTVLLRDTRSGQEIRRHEFEFPVHYASFSPDSRHLLVCAGKSVRLWEVSSGKASGPLLKHDREVFLAVANSDGSRVASACDDGTVHVWDVIVGKETCPPLWHMPRARRTIPSEISYSGSELTNLRHTYSLHSMRFSANGRRLLTAGMDGKARLWDVASGQPVGPLVEHAILNPGYWQMNIGGPAWNAEGDRLATRSSNSTAQVWDADKGQPVGASLSHTGGLAALTFSPDSRRLLSTSNDNTALQWDVATGKRLTPAMRHAGYVECGVYSPDGLRIATVASGDAARIWDAATGLPLTPSLKSQQGGNRVCFSPDGRRLFRWRFNQKSLSIWDVSRDDRPIEDLVKRTNLLASHQLDVNGDLTPLTREELRQLGQNLPPWPWRSSEESITWKTKGDAYLFRGYRTNQFDRREVLCRRAIAAFTRCIDLNPQNKESWLGRGEAYSLLGGCTGDMDTRNARYDKAVEDFSQALELSAGADVRAWSLRGERYYRMGRWDKAAADYTQVLKRKPGYDITALSRRGESFAELGQWDKAVADVSKLVEGTPDRIYSWRCQAACQLEKGDVDGYKQTCASMVKRFGKNGKLSDAFALAEFCTAVPDAIADFAELPTDELEKKRQYLAYQNQLLAINYRMGKYQQALNRSHEQILGGAAGYTLYRRWLFLAMIHHRLRHAGQAKKFFDMADQPLAKFPFYLWSHIWGERAMLRSLRREAAELLKEKN